MSAIQLMPAWKKNASANELVGKKHHIQITHDRLSPTGINMESTHTPLKSIMNPGEIGSKFSSNVKTKPSALGMEGLMISNHKRHQSTGSIRIPQQFHGVSNIPSNSSPPLIPRKSDTGPYVQAGKSHLPRQASLLEASVHDMKYFPGENESGNQPSFSNKGVAKALVPMRPSVPKSLMKQQTSRALPKESSQRQKRRSNSMYNAQGEKITGMLCASVKPPRTTPIAMLVKSSEKINKEHQDILMCTSPCLSPESSKSSCGPSVDENEVDVHFAKLPSKGSSHRRSISLVDEMTFLKRHGWEGSVDEQVEDAGKADTVEPWMISDEEVRGFMEQHKHLKEVRENRKKELFSRLEEWSFQDRAKDMSHVTDSSDDDIDDKD